MAVPITINEVTKIFGKDTIIDKLSLAVQPGEFFTLLGPSGCGKTTLLRMIIGFNSIEGGTISVAGRVINEVPTNLRNMGLVFQNYAVFPHLSVEENVAFGLKMRKIPLEDRAKKVDEILKLVKIDHLKKRMPTQLSGGQQQRVALARAIVIHPEVLLMDEPLSNLDAKLRVEMRNVIKQIQQQIGITTVYVTHDQEEALAVSDRIAVMNHGQIQQVGTPRQIYTRPANQFVATFIGQSNVLEAKLEKDLTHGENPVLVFSNDYQVPLTTLREDASCGAVRVSVRPEEFVLAPYVPGQSLRVRVKHAVFLGFVTQYFLESDAGEEWIALQTDSANHWATGSELGLTVRADKINVFDDKGEKSLIREGC